MTAFIPLRAFALALTCAALLVACGKKEDPGAAKAPVAAGEAKTSVVPAPPTDREVKIMEVRPKIDALKVGDVVRLAIYGTYRVPEQGGNLGIVIQDGKGGLLSSKLVPVKGGSGNFEQEVEFKVPATDRVALNVPLYLKDETTSVTVATQEFKVAPAK